MVWYYDGHVVPRASYVTYYVYFINRGSSVNSTCACVDKDQDRKEQLLLDMMIKHYYEFKLEYSIDHMYKMIYYTIL